MSSGKGFTSALQNRLVNPQIAAAENDYVECARLLLEHRAEVDCRNASHQTPLHLACLSQSIGTVDLLISYGANVNAVYRDGRTALHAAIVKQSRSLDCCNALLKAGADVNKVGGRSL